MLFESDYSRDASPQRDRMLLMSYRKATRYYWIIIGGVAVVIIIFIFASNILKRPSAATIVISVLVVLIYVALAYFCRPKHPARDPSDFLLPVAVTPLTWSQNSSMRHQTAEIRATIDLAIPVFSYSRKAGDENSNVTSPRQLICSVCLALLVEGEQVRQLPECKHIFHADCIAKWLPLHMSCPICRSEVDMTKYDVQDTEERRSFDSTEHPVGSLSVV